MAYEIKGLVQSVGEVQAISDKFSKREIVIEHGDKYPQCNSFEVVNDKTSMLDGINPGDTVTIWFDLNGRPPKQAGGRVFNQNRIWKLNVDSKAARSAQSDLGGSDSIPF